MALKRLDWQSSQDRIDPERLVFLDETSLKTNLTRLRGWADGGQRLVEAIPAGKWQTNTLVHAIALDGTRAAMVLDGPINGPSFAGFCRWLLAPQLHAGDLLVMDNLSSHKNRSAMEAIEAVGAKVVFLPPYSPDLNPIENVFSKIKQLVRRLRPRTLTQIVRAAAEAINKVKLQEIAAIFEHCGYGNAV